MYIGYTYYEWVFWASRVLSVFSCVSRPKRLVFTALYTNCYIDMLSIVVNEKNYITFKATYYITK